MEGLEARAVKTAWPLFRRGQAAALHPRGRISTATKWFLPSPTLGNPIPYDMHFIPRQPGMRPHGVRVDIAPKIDCRADLVHFPRPRCVHAAKESVLGVLMANVRLIYASLFVPFL